MNLETTRFLAGERIRTMATDARAAERAALAGRARRGFPAGTRLGRLGAAIRGGWGRLALIVRPAPPPS
jgi:hypothetical protein